MRLALALLAFGLATLSSALTIENMAPGAKVRHPVVILRGSASGSSVKIGLSPKWMRTFPVVGGRFVGTAELVAGANMVNLVDGAKSVKIRIDYRPMTTPYRVRVIYVTAQDEDTRYDSPYDDDKQAFREKLDTALKMLQAFTAEAMHEAGYGRKTFALEFAKNGRVVVNVVKHPRTGDDLRKLDGMALYGVLGEWLEPNFPTDTFKNCVLMGFTRYDRATQKALAHTALGGGVQALFGSGSMYTWPSSLEDAGRVFADATALDPSRMFDDSAFRRTVWGSAATTMGAVLHELGHTFGLPHTVDDRCIMSRGFDRLNRAFTAIEPPRAGQTEPTKFAANETPRWDPYFATRLNWHPWFQPDGYTGGRALSKLKPTVSIDSIADEVIIRAPYGIRIVGAQTEGKPYSFDKYTEKSPPTVLKLSRTELRRRAASPLGTSVYVMDDQGNEVTVDDKAAP